ncbi:hypothetical protein GCM10028802_09280 [Terrabacter terrigena]
MHLVARRAWERVVEAHAEAERAEECDDGLERDAVVAGLESGDTTLWDPEPLGEATLAQQAYASASVVVEPVDTQRRRAGAVDERAAAGNARCLRGDSALIRVVTHS